MTESPPVERALIEQFLESLRELPDVHAELDALESGASADDRVDAQIHLNVAGKSIVLLVEAKKTVYPRDVRQVLWQFKSLQHGRYADAQNFLIAESLSPGAKELLRAERIGYYDNGGSLFLPASGAYVYIDKPPPKTLEKSVRSLFSGRRAQVLHALLVNHEEWFGVTEVAEQAQVAPSTASDVLGELERFDWLVSRGQGPSKERHLREPGALLDAWAKQLATQRAPTLRRYFVPGAKGTELLVEGAQGGRNVLILTNSLAANDVAAVHGGYMEYRPALLRGGVQLWELKPTSNKPSRFSLGGSSGSSLHTKAMIVDADTVFVGSYNLDPRSTSLNSEQGVLVSHPVLAEQLTRIFDRQTSPQRAWKVSVDDKGTVWTDGTQTFRKEPDAPTSRRFMAWLMKVLPVESQL